MELNFSWSDNEADVSLSQYSLVIHVRINAVIRDDPYVKLMRCKHISIANLKH